MLDLHPNILEFEGRKAFVVLPYAEYLEIEEQLQQLEDIRTLRQAKNREADAPTVTLSEARARYDLEQPPRQEQLPVAAISLTPELTESLESAALQSQRSVSELIQEAVSGYLAARWREQLEQEITAYESMHAELWRDLPGMWVAIHNGELVDQDRDKVALYRRTRDRFGRIPVLMREVKAAPTEEIWLRTPSTGRLPR